LATSCFSSKKQLVSSYGKGHVLLAHRRLVIYEKLVGLLNFNELRSYTV
jgi:hypothetical protein